METKYFEDFQVGESFATHGRTITETDLVNYAGLGGNFHPVHLDEAMMRESDYGHRLVYGFLVVIMMQGLKIQTGMLDDSVVALYRVDDLAFREPVETGETIHSEITVRDVEERDEETGVVTLAENGVNQDDDVVLSARTETLVRKRPSND